ncbi:unnamed protein product [Prorocentrum cordatum]|uniref:Uncharacterized protein n=1 Tax=Prorocentrum cordatum TaxID=2364126 RepID=A0ABN9PLF6_9DINO|nr:unnamed protein product [Polarella glacialis]
MFDTKQALEREVQEQAEKAAVAAKAKLANKLRQKQQELKSAEKASSPPESLFRSGANAGLYSEFDDAGVPTKLADGSEVSAKKRKDFAKERSRSRRRSSRSFPRRRRPPAAWRLSSPRCGPRRRSSRGRSAPWTAPEVGGGARACAAALESGALRHVTTASIVFVGRPLPARSCQFQHFRTSANPRRCSALAVSNTQAPPA